MSRDLAQPISGAPAPRDRESVEAVIALGANLGDRERTLALAAEELGRLPMSSLIACSDPHESVALTLTGPDAEAPAYLNAVARVRTSLEPRILLDYLHRIEERHGRVRRERWGARTLDLDLITYGELASDDPEVLLPHPRAAEREFVLAPWLDIDPDAVLPGAGLVADVLNRLRQECS